MGDPPVLKGDPQCLPLRLTPYLHPLASEKIPAPEGLRLSPRSQLLQSVPRDPPTDSWDLRGPHLVLTIPTETPKYVSSFCPLINCGIGAPWSPVVVGYLKGEAHFLSGTLPSPHALPFPGSGSGTLDLGNSGVSLRSSDLTGRSRLGPPPKTISCQGHRFLPTYHPLEEEAQEPEVPDLDPGSCLFG